MIEDIVLPTFEIRFAQKFTSLQKRYPETAKKILNIKTEADCIDYGPDCVIAIDRFNETIQRFYRIFSILNKDYREDISSTNSKTWSQFIGSLLVNLNYQFDSHDQEMVSDDSNNRKDSYHKSITSFQINKDLKRLLQHIISADQMSLADMISLLGYSDVIGDISNNDFNTESFSDCLPSKASSEDNTEASSITKLEKIESSLQGNEYCDMEHYLQRWNTYLQFLSDSSTNKNSKCASGMNFTIIKIY